MEGPTPTRSFFPATTLRIPALWRTGAGELSGSDPSGGPFWLEPALRTRVRSIYEPTGRAGQIGQWKATEDTDLKTLPVV